ncbi:DUF2065 domain-containing protein [Maritimibacter sp. 55A14]|uniref:DUF2065 domain-containing protein n=1 Tax=Maritimibacter sp. 55A14 TaxID=2174844 RepID=UPI000D60BD03|nr:DUF2065 domain-containing protein [Maritimibacter sp. 55A14]PWE32051.1 DUF2065 domain-containing protein [Maritimibacter sp. 55A14]
MAELVLALGFVAVIEGLVLALAPLRFEELLEWLRSLDAQVRRTLGLGMVAFGVALIWLAKSVLG